MKRYVDGFLFDKEGDWVALIKKNRPEWQAGKLNGIGGKVEPGELAEEAMPREFVEETGRMTSGWKQFLVLHESNGDIVHFFYLFSSDDIYGLESTTDEFVSTYPTHVDLPNVLPNLRWLIPMALSFGRGERADSFELFEKGAGDHRTNWMSTEMSKNLCPP